MTYSRSRQCGKTVIYLCLSCSSTPISFESEKYRVGFVRDTLSFRYGNNHFSFQFHQSRQIQKGILSEEFVSAMCPAITQRLVNVTS